jgi:hypothetical protein
VQVFAEQNISLQTSSNFLSGKRGKYPKFKVSYFLKKKKNTYICKHTKASKITKEKGKPHHQINKMNFISSSQSRLATRKLPNK